MKYSNISRVIMYSAFMFQYFEEYKLDQGNMSTPALKDYKTNFMSYIGMASQFPNFFMNLVNLFVQCKGLVFIY